MIESTSNISSEMNIMEAELKENESIYLENCCRLELSKCSKMKISNFQSIVCENYSKLETNYLHNLKEYYVLTQYVSG